MSKLDTDCVKEVKTMRAKFSNDYVVALATYKPVNKLVVAVKLPTGVTEIIINTEAIESKVNYYLNAYDDHMCLKTNPNVKVLSWMFVG